MAAAPAVARRGGRGGNGPPDRDEDADERHVRDRSAIACSPTMDDDPHDREERAEEPEPAEEQMRAGTAKPPGGSGHDHE
jgi:hypothetical protein